MSSEEQEKPKEELPLDEKKEEGVKDSLVDENLDYKKLYYSQPSQKDKVKKDFSEYSEIDMSLLNKKRERTVENEVKENNTKLTEEKNLNLISEEKKEENIENKIIENTDNNKKEEEVKENDLENNLPKELLDLIEERKNKEPFTLEDFEKYKAYKKLNDNLIK